MSTRTRIALTILNIICIPVNVWSISRGIVWCANGEWGPGIMQVTMGTIALVWCTLVVIAYTNVLLKRSKSQ